MTEPTIRDLLNRIDQLETKLTPPQPESMSARLMRIGQAARAKNTVTIEEAAFIKGATSKTINAQLRKAGGA